MKTWARGTAAVAAAILVLCGSVLVPAAVSSSQRASSTALPRNDYLLILNRRAGPFRYVDTLREGMPQAYPAAVRAFGQPTKLETEFLDERILYQEQTAGFCHVTWGKAGITVSLFAFSGWWPQGEDDEPTPKIQPCAAKPLATADFIALSLFGPQWHNRTGIRVGRPLPPGVRAGPRQNVPSSRWGGKAMLALSVSLDRDGRVRAMRVEILGVP
jgi:hypothetical protein